MAYYDWDRNHNTPPADVIDLETGEVIPEVLWCDTNTGELCRVDLSVGGVHRYDPDRGGVAVVNEVRRHEVKPHEFSQMGILPDS